MSHEVLWRLVRRHGWVRPEGSLRLRGLSPVMRLAAAVDAMVQGADASIVDPHPGAAQPSPSRGG